VITKILISPFYKDRVEKIKKIIQSYNLTFPHPDLLYFDDSKKLGVEQAKKIREFLSLKPYQSNVKAVVVESTQNMTFDAQNSLLKTLEEPAEETVILLSANSEHSLLPTILSRCEIIFLESSSAKASADKSKESEKSNDLTKDIEKLISYSVEERFDYIEKLEEKEEFFKSLVFYFHQNIAARKISTNPKTLEFAKKLLEAEKWQKANGNLRAILEYLVMNLPS
jgi:DNA polymerase III delta prime subunit